MNFERSKKDCLDHMDKVKAALLGKTLVGINPSIVYPGHFETVELTFSDGSSLSFQAGSSGCPECDPENYGAGVNVSFSKE